MEIVDTLIVLAIPGARRRPHGPALLGQPGGALVIAGVAAYPVNRRLIAHGKATP